MSPLDLIEWIRDPAVMLLTLLGLAASAFVTTVAKGLAKDAMPTIRRHLRRLYRPKGSGKVEKS